jgi:pyruvate kinase
VADILHLVQAGATGLVLAEETAIGRFPRDAVAVLRTLAGRTGEAKAPAAAVAHAGGGKGRR